MNMARFVLQSVFSCYCNSIGGCYNIKAQRSLKMAILTASWTTSVVYWARLPPLASLTTSFLSNDLI